MLNKRVIRVYSTERVINLYHFFLFLREDLRAVTPLASLPIVCAGTCLSLSSSCTTAVGAC